MAVDVSSSGGALLITLLRTLHIVFGLIWVGAALLLTLYIEPTAEAAGAEGKRVLRALYRSTSLPRLIPAAALITTLAGLLLYEMLTYSAAIATGAGLMITVGALVGLLAFLARPFLSLASRREVRRPVESRR